MVKIWFEFTLDKDFERRMPGGGNFLRKENGVIIRKWTWNKS